MQSPILRNLLKTAVLCIGYVAVLCIHAAAQTGTWTPVTNLAPHYNEGVMLLLTDGSVICKTSSGGDLCAADDNIGNTWDKLTPVNGSYVNGTWSTIASMDSPRLYFSSQVLRDGRVYVCGGEYGGGGKWGEIYDPVANHWSPTGTGGTGLGYPFVNVVSDANSELLINGKILQACVDEAGVNLNYLYDPATNSYTAGPNCLRIDNEAVWVKLPDNSVLFMDNYGMTSERYIPATNTWVNDAVAPVNLFDPYGFEAGAAYLLPDGRVWFIGSTPNTLYYTPSGTASPGTWAVGPAIPDFQGAPDAASVMMPNGHVLVMLSPTPTSGDHFPSPTKYYEFDYTTNTFTQIGAPGGGMTSPNGSYISNTLMLPDGNVLFCDDGTDQYYIYTPGSGPLAAGQPTIDSVISINCNTYLATGKLFNGISEGAAYGDDWQMSTNYPIVRLTSGTNTYYATTSNWNRQGAVMTGALEDTTTFTLPAGLPAGTYSVQVIANGNPSAPRPFTTGTIFVTGPITGTTSFCMGATSTLADTSVGGVWSSSNLPVATVGSSTGIVTGVSGGTATISYTKTYPCGTQSVTTVVTINPPSAGTITGSHYLFVDSTLTLSDAVTGGTWSSSSTAIATVGSVSGIVTGVATGTVVITYTASTSCGGASATFTIDVSVAYVPSCVPVSGLLAWYDFDSSARNSWSLADNGVPYGGVSYGKDRFGNLHSCYVGNGASAIDIPQSNFPSGNASRSFAAWYKAPVPDYSVPRVILSTGSNAGSGHRYTLFTYDTTAGWESENVGLTRHQPVDSAWHHLVATYPTTGGGTSGVKVYFDGLLATTTLGGSPIGSLTTDTGTVHAIGTLFMPVYDGAWLYSWIGSLDDMGVWNRALTPCEVWTLYRCNMSDAIVGASTVCVGATTALTDGLPGGTWSSSVTSVATISSTGLVTGLAGGITIISYTGTTPCGPYAIVRMFTVNPMPDAGVITGTGLICAGATTLLTDAIAGGTWSSGSVGVASVSSTGLVTGITNGTATISYTLTNSCGSGSATFIVTVSPTTTAGTLSGSAIVCVGATTTLSDALSGGTWSSGSPGIATVGSTGIVTGLSGGTSTISYSVISSCGTALATRVVTVNTAPVVTSINGTPVVCVASTTALTNATTGGTWSGSPTGVATVGSTGIVTGISAGTATISYAVTNSCGTTIVTQIVTVNPLPAVGSISGTATVCVSSNISLTDAITGGVWSSVSTGVATVGSTGIVAGVSAGTSIISYTVTNSCGTAAATVVVTVIAIPSAGSITGTPVVCVAATTALTDAAGGGVWSSVVPGVASISSSGIVTGVTAGTSTISYTVSNSCGAVAATVVVTVNPLPVVTAINGTPVMCPTTTASLSDATTGGVWSSVSTGIATVGTTGAVTGVSAGTSTISYTVTNSCGTIAATVVATVNPAPVAGSITGTPVVCALATTALTDIAGGGVWSSVAPGVAGVGTSGIVTGVTAGTSTISYTVSNSCGTVAATVVVTVNPLPVVTTINGTPVLCPGTTASLSDATAGGVWSSVSPGIATVGSTGVVTGVSAGTSTISYTETNSCGTIAATIVATVNPAPVAGSITGTPVVCALATTALTDAAGGGVWSSVAPGVATVSTSGIVTGVVAGTSTISYTVSNSCGTVAATVVVTVNPLPVVTAISGLSAMCPYGTASLTDATTGGAWSSVSPWVATVASTGLVTGASAGTTTVSYTITNSCGVIAATDVVTVNPLPNAGIITGALIVCPATTSVLSDAVTGGIWSSSDPGVAMVSASGILTGITVGTAVISYAYTNSCGTAFATAIATVNALPIAGSIEGATLVCPTTSITLSDPASGGGGVWSSASPAIATIGSTSGVLTGIAAGSAIISYTITNSCATAFTTTTVTVHAAPTTITGPGILCQENTVVLSDSVADGTWSSGNAAVASVSPGSLFTEGLVSGVTVGTAIISYVIAPGCFAAKTVTVNPLSPVSVADRLCVTSTEIATDAPGGGTWSSNNPSVATISSTGVVTGLASGVTIISYSLGTGCVTAAVVTVNMLPPNYYVTGGGAYCSSGTGVHIGLDGSDAGISYHLLYGGSTVGTYTGTGFAIDFGAYTLPGTYKVLATNDSTTCAAMMGDSATITVSPEVTPFVSIGADPGTVICEGTLTTFVAVPVNGGSSPSYNWSVNGTGTGSGSTFAYIPNNGDVVSVMLTSDAACALPATATGSVVMTTSAGLLPSLTISVSPGDSVCPGAPVVITPTPIYGGSTPLYSWFKNGSYEGSGSTYSFVPLDGDNVLCWMHSVLTCSLEDSVHSDNNINMHVPPVDIPGVAILAIPGTRVAVGETDTLIASVTFAGLSLSYQWEINGSAVPGATTDTFIHSGFANHDVVSCAVTDYSTCGSTMRNASVIIVDTVALGVSGIHGPGNLELIPNPNNGQFTLKGWVATHDDAVTLEITDMLGRSIYKAKVNLQNETLDEQIQLSSELANGMYLLAVKWTGGGKVFHFVVEK